MVFELNEDRINRFLYVSTLLLGLFFTFMMLKYLWPTYGKKNRGKCSRTSKCDRQKLLIEKLENAVENKEEVKVEDAKAEEKGDIFNDEDREVKPIDNRPDLSQCIPCKPCVCNK